MLKIYESILNYSLNVKYADKNLGAYKGNPLLDLVLAYYIGFIEKLLKSKENDWILESVKSLSNVSNVVLQKTDKVEESFLFNFEKAIEILLKEISYNLKYKIFDTEYLINRIPRCLHRLELSKGIFSS
ncbi:MAG: hypothetical protein KAI71_04770 [Candidatus Pacebacteria bacterium]|nr:hypothetical protein [Candidatus Paceibacterota bacterium]